MRLDCDRIRTCESTYLLITSPTWYHYMPLIAAAKTTENLCYLCTNLINERENQRNESETFY